MQIAVLLNQQIQALRNSGQTEVQTKLFKMSMDQLSKANSLNGAKIWSWHGNLFRYYSRLVADTPPEYSMTLEPPTVPAPTPSVLVQIHERLKRNIMLMQALQTLLPQLRHPIMATTEEIKRNTIVLEKQLSLEYESEKMHPELNCIAVICMINGALLSQHWTLAEQLVENDQYSIAYLGDPLIPTSGLYDEREANNILVKLSRSEIDDAKVLVCAALCQQPDHVWDPSKQYHAMHGGV